MKWKRFGLDGGGRKLTDVERKEEVLAGYNNNVRICYVFLENFSCFRLNLVVMKNVATMKS